MKELFGENIEVPKWSPTMKLLKYSATSGPKMPSLPPRPRPRYCLTGTAGNTSVIRPSTVPPPSVKGPTATGRVRVVIIGLIRRSRNVTS